MNSDDFQLDTKQITENISKMNCTLTEHAYMIGDTNAIANSLVEKFDIVEQTLESNKETFDKLKQQLSNLNSFTKNELKDVLGQTKILYEKTKYLDDLVNKSEPKHKQKDEL